jgi:chromosome segregation protein
MKIKRLEMIGFKSFVDRTVVTFDHEVIAIVGPNGCGKSNIVDAIRWCMGEQSAKHLRGRSMEDVIFSGSESRAGHDAAEVTLTFENDGGDVPIEYRDYPEIAVTRRLQRTGESDYLINKTPVRLKDVTDLFLGTGAGTKAYSIIEQGKIGLIVSAKPEDRRLLIEEAAGITKYKSRKKQAERKMELTQQNLLRVGDIVTEIERNLDSLRRQAAKAERYLAYRREVEDLQLYEASHRYLEATGWIKLESAEVLRLGADVDAARVDLIVSEAELETARQAAHEVGERQQSAHDASFGAENAARVEEAAIDRAKDKLATLREREAQAKTEGSELREQATRLGSERDAVASALVSLESEEHIQAEAMEGHQEHLRRVEQEHTSAEGIAKDLLVQASVARTTIASAEAKLAGFDRRRADMLGRKEKFAAEEEVLGAVLLEHRAREEAWVEALRDMEGGKVATAAEQARAEEDLKALRIRIAESERTLDQAKGDLAKARSRMHALLEVQAKLEGVGQGVKALLATKDPVLVGLVADRVEAPRPLIPALAALLGSLLEDVVVTDLSRGIELLDELARRSAGRATIVAGRSLLSLNDPSPLPSDESVVARLFDELRFAPEDEPLVRALVGDAIVVRDVEGAVRLRANGAGGALVTLGGTVLHADGRVSGGSGEDLAAHMLETKRETRELGQQVAEMEEVVTRRLEGHQELRLDIGRQQALLDAARSRAHEGELSLVSAQRDLKSVQVQVEHLTRRANTVRSEVSELDAELLLATEEGAAAQHDLGEARLRLEEATAHITHATELAASWREQVEERRAEVMEHKITVAATRERLVAHRGMLQRLTKSADELEQRAGRIEEELLANSTLFSETAALLVQHQERLGVALDESRLRAEALAEVRAEFEALRGDLTSRENGLRDLRSRLDSCREELGRHEIALREQEIVLRHLTDSVAEKFRGLSLARVVGDYHMRPPPDAETHGRIGELTVLIERMGSVNLDAVREHEEAEKRFVFYSEQKADLDKALADLERAIQQMNRESKRLFAETFEAVNLRFQDVFPRMFHGGRAALRLTNPEDLLETGIDILAQPPGKKLSNIELMSGGEKALTAVSLIFAIFQIKPSPFCILDEVDAPLDEANVARYNDLIRSMTDRSQFILITHIKRTMQLADVLYGVTMQESGVSRLVSVRMNAANATREKKPAEFVEAVA